MIEAHPDVAPPPHSLSGQLREATAQLHTRAERTGFVALMLRGQASRDGYALYARNLLPAYEAMELGLERHATSPVIGPLAQPAVYRASALAADLNGLAGASWRQSLRPLPAARHYADRIAAVAAEGNGERLLAHAYVRYLGDLNGGRVLARLLARNLGLESAALSFYEFPDIADLAAFKHAYRAAIDDAADELDDPEGLVAEARTAFEMNIAVSEAVLAETPKQSQASA